MNATKKVFYIKCYTKSQLAAELGFKSIKEFTTEMKKIGQEDKLKKDGWYYFPKHVEEILMALGRIKKLSNFANVA